MKKYSRFLGKIAKSGFYIILFLCIAAIGVSGYVMFIAKDAVKDNEIPKKIESSLELPFPNDNTEEYGLGEAVMSQGKPSQSEKTDSEEKPTDKKVTNEKTAPASEKPTAPASEKSTAPTSEKSTAQAAPKAAPAKEPDAFTVAVSGTVAMPFSGTELVKSETMGDWRIHAGVDIAADAGVPVLAIADGTVTQVAADTMMGNVVKLEHSGGLVSIYANLEDNITLKQGDKIKAGDTIGKVGTSALAECMEPPHLHLEVMRGGKHIDPLSLFPAGQE